MAGDITLRENHRVIPLEPGDAFKTISNSRRRRVLLSLDCSDTPISAGDLAVEIAAIENGIKPSAVTSEQRSRVYITLTQVHLNALHDVGAVQYDSRSKQVTPTDATAGLAEAIRRTKSSCYSLTSEHGAE